MASRDFLIRFLGDPKGAVTATDSLDRVLGGHGKTLAAVTAAGAALGAGIESLARKEQARTLQVRQLSEVTGIQESELRKLTNGLANHTLSVDDTLRAQDRLVESGVKTREGFEQIIPAADTLADALGWDIVRAIDVSDRALSALGIPLTELEDHMDTVTFLSKETTLNMDNLGMTFRREQRGIEDLGLTFDDVAVALAALEANGRRGPRAVMGFQEALRNANGDVEAFWQHLDVGNDQLELQRERLADSAGRTQALADAYESTITPLQRMQSWMDRQVFAHGEAIEKAAQLAPLLIALGPAMAILTAGANGARAAIVATSGAMTAMRGGAATMSRAMAALASPLGIGAVTAALIVGVAAWQRWRGTGVEVSADISRAIKIAADDTEENINRVISSTEAHIDALERTALALREGGEMDLERMRTLGELDEAHRESRRELLTYELALEKQTEKVKLQELATWGSQKATELLERWFGITRGTADDLTESVEDLGAALDDMTYQQALNQAAADLMAEGYDTAEEALRNMNIETLQHLQLLERQEGALADVRRGLDASARSAREYNAALAAAQSQLITPGMDRSVASDINRWLHMGLESHGDGGIVGGPIGAPRLIMAHGGETVLPTHKSGVSLGGGVTVNVYALDPRSAADAVEDSLIDLVKRGALSPGALNA